MSPQTSISTEMGKPVLYHSLEVFDAHPDVDALCVDERSGD